MEGGGQIPVTAGGQEPADRDGYRDGMPGMPAGGGVVRGGVQIGALGFQPGDRLPEGGKVRDLRRRAARRLLAERSGPGVEVPAGSA